MTSPIPHVTEDIRAYNKYLLSLGPLDHAQFAFTPIPVPSDIVAKCTLSLIQPGMMSHFPAGILAKGEEPAALFSAPSYSFLIEKEMNGETLRVLYEMGLRDVCLDLFEIRSFANHC